MQALYRRILSHRIASRDPPRLIPLSINTQSSSQAGPMEFFLICTFHSAAHLNLVIHLSPNISPYQPDKRHANFSLLDDQARWYFQGDPCRWCICNEHTVCDVSCRDALFQISLTMQHYTCTTTCLSVNADQHECDLALYWFHPCFLRNFHLLFWLEEVFDVHGCLSPGCWCVWTLMNCDDRVRRSRSWSFLGNLGVGGR